MDLKKTAIIPLYSINWLGFITEMKCLLRGTDRIFKYKSLILVLKGLILRDM